MDVLAVIREGFDLVPRVSEDDPMAPALGDWMRRMSRVQDAVAELIEAARAVDAPATNCDPEEWARDRRRLRAALARISPP
ncbi:hypothetical protein ACLMLE_06495 [Lysobacter capsici]